MTANNNSNNTSVYWGDWLELSGGVPFAGGVSMGKGWGGCSVVETFSFAVLGYVDTSVAAVPAAPDISGCGRQRPGDDHDRHHADEPGA